MQETSISWTDWVWNCIRGCSRISPGCQRCYAEKIAARFSRPGKTIDCMGPRGEVYQHETPDDPFYEFAEFRIVGGKREAHWTGKVELVESKLLEPLSWRKKALKFAEKHGRKPRCFVNSMSDLFHVALPDLAIDRVFAVMALCPQIDFLVLTKRAERMAECFSGPDLYNRRLVAANHIRAVFADACNVGISDPVCFPPKWIWLGVSVEDQRRADQRIPHLLRTPAAVRFLSCEPLIESLDLMNHIFCVECAEGRTDQQGYRGAPCSRTTIDWVIAGAESGPGARPCNEDWIRSLRDQCVSAGTAFFYKQWAINGRKVDTPELDGKRWVEFPEVRG